MPGIVPVLGQLDDLAAVLLALRFALRGLPGPAADALLATSGLSRELLARDLDNVRVTAAWTARGAARAGVRAAAVAGRGIAGASRLATRAARAGLGRVARRRGGSR